MEKRKWIDVWQDNYRGVSEEAKELETFLKKNYKGHGYIPWATMVRLMNTQDPEAELEVLLKQNSYDGDPLVTSGNNVSGDLLHTSERTLDVDDGTTSTSVGYFSHFVMLRCKFLGKEFIETYPVQDNSYAAPKIINQNMVNNAIQRAKAKVISIATGLAFSLYEIGDLQFEEDKEKSNVKKVVTKKDDNVKKVVTKKDDGADTKVNKPAKDTKPKKEKVEVEEDETWSEDVCELAEFIHGNEAIKDKLQRINASVVKKYGFSLSIEEPIDELCKKIANFNSPKTTLNVLKK